MTDAESEDPAPHEKWATAAERNAPARCSLPMTRLSSKVLIGLGAIAELGISSALFLALEPQRKPVGSELYATDGRNTPDGLMSLPKDDTELPRGAARLGPPLPGDLGRPILSAGAPAPTIADAAKRAPRRSKKRRW